MSGELGVHVLVYSFPAQGHLLPTIDLLHHLLNHGLTVTIVVTPKNLPLFEPLILNHHPSSAIKTLVLPFPNHPSIPTGVENLKDMPPSGSCVIDLMTALTHLHQPLLNWFQRNSSPPSAIISDMFSGWTQRLAEQLGIPRYVFSPTGALAFSVIQSLWQDCPRRKNVNDENEVVSFPNIPNSPKYPWWQISAIYRSYVQEEGKNPDSEGVREGFISNMVGQGILINTFTELENEYVDHLKRIMGHNKVWPIGPLLQVIGNNYEQTERGGSCSNLASEISRWLDGCENGSVVYVSFGSQHVLSNKQMETIAQSLEKSELKFIWVVKGATAGHAQEDYGNIPTGFQDRMAGRGLVIKEWAPQVVILRHPAIGAFLTHCGWNSSLESLAAGVPMLAWPMTADQYANATLLVDELKVAIRVGEGEKKSPTTSELAKLMDLNAMNSNKSRSLELKKAALQATGVAGASSLSWADFIMQLTHHNKLELNKENIIN